MIVTSAVFQAGRRALLSPFSRLHRANIISVVLGQVFVPPPRVFRRPDTVSLPRLIMTAVTSAATTLRGRIDTVTAVVNTNGVCRRTSVVAAQRRSR
ncbi:hypothetical protein ACI65C_005797 [Semiaphis heraclei]